MVKVGVYKRRYFFVFVPVESSIFVTHQQLRKVYSQVRLFLNGSLVNSLLSNHDQL